MRRTLVLCSLAVAGAAFAQEAESRPASRAYEFAKVDAAAERFLALTRLPGAGLSVRHEGRLVHERYFGAYTKDTVVPIASASKWLAGALMMALVDREQLDLDAKVGKYLPEWGERAITVRMLFNHTSGLPAEAAAKNDVRKTLRLAARELAELEPVGEPGAAFAYGGVSMQVGGAIAEVAGGKPWRALFDELITAPLALHDTRFGRLAINRNPQIAGGASSTLADYARFVAMVLDEGELDGRRVLSKESARALIEDHVGATRMQRTALARLAGASGYAVGCWVDAKDAQGATLQASSPGLFGFLPWIDRQRRLAAVWMIEDRQGARRTLRAELPDIRRLVTEAIDAAR